MRIRQVAVATLVLLVAVLAGAVRPAHAAPGDRITRLAVTYTVNADSSVDVDYRVDYHFGAKDRHGITFSIATGEVLPTDRSRTVSYGVQDVRVSDGQGQSVPYTTQNSSNYSTERTSLDLRIGDPERTIDGTEASYRIRWHGTGMLRTVDGQPRLHWNVTSHHMPPIDALEVQVVTPGATSNPRCHGMTCQDQALTTGHRFTGGPVSADTLVAVQLDLAKGSVRGIAPVTEVRLPPQPLSLASNVSWTVARDGSMQVVEDHDVLGTGYQTSTSYHVTMRQPQDETTDRLTPVEGFTASWDGRPLDVEWSTIHEDTSYQAPWATVELPKAVGRHRLRIAYTARAVVDRGRVSWPVTSIPSDEGTQQTLTATLPAPVTRADCTKEPPQDRTVRCTFPIRYAFERNSASIGMDEASVPQAVAILEPSLDHHRAMLQRKALGGGALGTLLLAGIPWLGRLRARRHRRYADTPPGVIADKGTQQVPDRGVEVPVRFGPPEVSLAGAGSLLGVKPSRVLAAVLAAMAVDGRVTVSHPPLVVRRSGAKPEDSLEVKVWYEANDPGRSAETLPKRITAMADDVEKAMASESGGLFQKGTREASGRRVATALGLALLGLLVLAGALARVFSVGAVLFFLVAAGSVLLASAGWAAGRPTRGLRSARGTAIHDQVVGFRSYLTTAEADQLRFEEDTDVFGRFLPWAILFDVADRWARVCGEAAAQGRIPDFDRDRFVALTAWSTDSSFSQDLDRSSHWSPPSSGGSGGSGGSSSWSGGSSSSSSSSDSGGGGGVSIDSW